MIRRAPLFFLLLFGLSGSLTAQDTLRVLHYNLLNYGNFTDFCTASNNNLNQKNRHLRTIVGYTQPDIFTANELADNASGAFAQSVLVNALNQDGRTQYARGTYTNEAGSNITNMLYYRRDRLALHSEDVITDPSGLRDINLYRLYHRSAEPIVDTTFLVCIVAHLKAGNDGDDRTQRARQTEALMDYLRDLDRADNYLLLADLNVYRSTEPAYQNLTEEEDERLRFYDPINRPGTWNASQFADLHTQSTRSSGGCHAGGGMDDRFDFILLNEYLIDDVAGAGYVPGSYRA
ncbi:MAG: hypothetical protein WBA12_08790, partial [Catalinimonas sp.]